MHALCAFVCICVLKREPEKERDWTVLFHITKEITKQATWEGWRKMKHEKEKGVSMDGNVRSQNATPGQIKKS